MPMTIFSVLKITSLRHRPRSSSSTNTRIAESGWTAGNPDAAAHRVLIGVSCDWACRAGYLDLSSIQVTFGVITRRSVRSKPAAWRGMLPSRTFYLIPPGGRTCSASRDSQGIPLTNSMRFHLKMQLIFDSEFTQLEESRDYELLARCR